MPLNEFFGLQPREKLLAPTETTRSSTFGTGQLRASAMPFYFCTRIVPSV